MSPRLTQIIAQQRSTDLYRAAEHDRRSRPPIDGPSARSRRAGRKHAQLTQALSGEVSR